MQNLNKFLFISLLLLISVVSEAQIKFGYAAPEIALPSASGDTIKLSSLKGKVVLIDFWASWCGPCRVSNKEISKIYAKYKSKGFEIFAVSIDANKKDWLRAIKQDKIKWLQVNDPGDWSAPIVAKWNIYGIPTSFLIDQQGKFIAMDLEPDDLEETLKEMLEK